MSQRNPMNERYQSEDHQGKTRKSAASAKPKSKAAASVVVQTSSKTPQQKKADAKAARRKAQDEQRALDRKYYTPDTKEYKRLRRLWWACWGVPWCARPARSSCASRWATRCPWALSWLRMP